MQYTVDCPRIRSKSVSTVSTVVGELDEHVAQTSQGIDRSIIDRSIRDPLVAALRTHNSLIFAFKSPF